MSVQRALSASQVSALKADGVHRVAPSLYLQIRPQGTRSWLFRYSRNGQNQWMGLGAAADKSLTEARDEAALLRVSTRKGGDLAGFGGVEHGIFELLQGNVAPEGLRFPSMGPPCVPGDVWHGCEPAMSLIPNLLITGIVSLVLGGFTLVWAIGFLHRRYAGFILALLCVALLLTGGGIVPAAIGIIGGVLCMWTPGPARHMLALRCGLAALWPWSLVALGTFLVGMVGVGYFYNDLTTSYGLLILVAIPALTLLSAFSAWARDGVA